MPLKDMFTYITDYNFKYVDVAKSRSDLNRKCCDCTDNCRNKLKCSCWQSTVRRTGEKHTKNFRSHMHVGYRNKRLHDIVYTGIVECGAQCKCRADQCVNRVVQNGLQLELELFQTEKKGIALYLSFELARFPQF